MQVHKSDWNNQLSSGGNRMNHSYLITKYCNFLLIIFALILHNQIATASATTYGCANANTSCTLLELFEGGSFEVDGLKFDQWMFISDSSTTPTEPDPSSIEVLMYDSEYLDARGSPGQGPGYEIYDPEYIYGDEYRNLIYKFQVSTLNNNHVIINNTLDLDGLSYTVGIVDGLLEVNELVTDILGNELATKNVFYELPRSENPPNNENLVDFAEFLPQSTINVETGFLESGSALNNENISLSLDSYTQRFGYTVVPIPPAIWLFGSGLMGLMGIARRRNERHA